MIRTLLVFMILFCFNSVLLTGQEKSVNNEDFQVFVDELDYDKTKKGLRVREQYKPKPQDFNNEDLIQQESIESGVFVFKIIAYIAIFLLVAFILYMVFSNIQTDKKIISSETVYNEIEDIKDIDSHAIYKNAIAEGNYLLAIRMHFIMCLQQLDKQERIDWEKEKTNRDYYRQISETEIKRSFRDIANIFERCCYADVTLDLQEFNSYDQRFLDFLNQVK